MNEFIRKAAPLCLALVLSLIGVAAILISEGGELAKETDQNKKLKKAGLLILSSLPQSLCLGAFSYDIWVVTTLFSADPKTLPFYNLVNKQDAIVLLMVIHFILYLFVLAWGGVVRGIRDDTTKKEFILEILLSGLAIVVCILYQAY